MKGLLFVTLLGASFSALANYCQVQMIDTRFNRVLDVFSAYDYNDGCKDGMRECRKQIRLRNLLDRADCVRVEQQPQPQP